MALRIKNPYFKSQVQIDAETLAPIVKTVLVNNAQSVGQIAGLGEIKALLLPADAAKLSRPVFNQVCLINSWEILNPEEPV